jgi:hypothetical protein
MTGPQNPFEQLVALARDPLSARMRFCTVTAVDPVTLMCSVDDGSGETIDGLPFYGGVPAVGESALLATFDSVAAVITAGVGGSSTWDGGTASLASHFLSTLEVDGALSVHSDIIMGDYTDGGDTLRIRGLFTPDQIEARLYIMSGGHIAIALIENGVEVNRFRINRDGAIASGPSGGRVMNQPFGVWVGTCTLPAIAAGGFSQVQCNFPSNRFTVPPICVVTANNSNVLATCGGATAASVQVVGREYQAGSSGGSVVYVHAIQMTPTAASA